MADPLDDPRITLAGLLFEVHDGLSSSLEKGAHPSTEVLLRLARTPDERLRMSDLAAQVTMSASGLSRAIDRLVAAGLIERDSCPTDRRVVYAHLTEQGRAEVAAFLPDHLARLEDAFSVLDADQRADLEALLRRLRDRVNPEAVAASEVPTA
jgi:DNA-binding MarR family transcriptional regulator